MPKLYSDLADYYDVIYADKDYRDEVERLHSIIQKRKKSKENTLLDVACGTGRHIEFLKKHYTVTGLDLNEEMLKFARERNEDVEFIQGDMSDFNLDRQFDVITCLFGSINYVRSLDRFEAAISTFSRHLKRGGILVLEPIFTEESFRDDSSSISCIEGENCKIARVGTSKREGDVARLEMQYLIASHGEILHFSEVHYMGLISISSIRNTLEEYGLEVEVISGGLGREDLFIGIKS